MLVINLIVSGSFFISPFFLFNTNGVGIFLPLFNCCSFFFFCIFLCIISSFCCFLANIELRRTIAFCSNVFASNAFKGLGGNSPLITWWLGTCGKFNFSSFLITFFGFDTWFWFWDGIVFNCFWIWLGIDSEFCDGKEFCDSILFNCSPIWFGIDTDFCDSIFWFRVDSVFNFDWFWFGIDSNLDFSFGLILFILVFLLPLFIIFPFELTREPFFNVTLPLLCLADTLLFLKFNFGACACACACGCACACACGCGCDELLNILGRLLLLLLNCDGVLFQIDKLLAFCLISLSISCFLILLFFSVFAYKLAIAPLRLLSNWLFNLLDSFWFILLFFSVLKAKLAIAPLRLFSNWLFKFCGVIFFSVLLL